MYSRKMNTSADLPRLLNTVNSRTLFGIFDALAKKLAKVDLKVDDIVEYEEFRLQKKRGLKERYSTMGSSL